MGSCKLSSVMCHWDGSYPIRPHGCLSRRQNAECVTYKTCIQTPASFAHLVAQKPDKHLYTQSVQNLISTETWFQKSITTKSYVKTGQQKAEFINDSFHIQSLQGTSWRFFTKNPIYTGWCNLPRIADSATGRVSDCRNSQIPNRLKSFNAPSESWESYLPKRYLGLLEFRPIRDLKLKICFAVVLFRKRFSNDVNRQNSITSKPFGGQSHMSNV
jgi:hypothetical protein